MPKRVAPADRKRHAVVTLLPRRVKKAVEHLAHRKQQSLSEYTRELLTQHIEAQEG